MKFIIRDVLKNCPICDPHRIKRVEGTVEIKIYRKVIRIPKVIYWICENCGEKIFFPDSLKHNENVYGTTC